MASRIIGRREEVNLLGSLLSSKAPEFLVPFPFNSDRSIYHMHAPVCLEPCQYQTSN